MSTVDSATVLLERVQHQITAQRVGLHDFFELHRSRIDDVRHELAAARTDWSDDYDILAQQRRELAQQHARINDDQHSLDELWARTRQQRQSIAQELNQQRRALRAEQQVVRARLSVVQRRVAESRNSEQPADAAEAELLDYAVVLEQQLAQSQRQIDQLNRAAAQREAEYQQALQQAAEQQQAQQPVADPLSKDRIDDALADDATPTTDTTELAALRKQFETAQEELHDALARISELESDLAEALRRRPQRSSSSVAADASSPSPLNWEAQKRIMLAALEADDSANSMPPHDRLTIEGTIEITDEIVAAKDREIADLRRELEQAKATSQPDYSELLNTDEVVQHERQRLRSLQQEWEEKMRVAEIDISVERAKIARQRAELEDKRSSIEHESHRTASRISAETGSESADPRASKGNWLARLGLRNQEDE